MLKNTLENIFVDIKEKIGIDQFFLVNIPIPPLEFNIVEILEINTSYIKCMKYVKTEAFNAYADTTFISKSNHCYINISDIKVIELVKIYDNNKEGYWVWI